MPPLSVESLVPELTIKPVRPVFSIARAIPDGMGPQIEEAVKDFIRSSGIPRGVDIQGFYNQTLQGIANAAIQGQGNDLWLGVAGDELWIYLLGHLGNDIDGRMTYTVSQAWVRKDQRGQKWVKEVWAQVRQRAKNCLCKHFMVISTKENDAVYCRFLGRGFHKYATLLKEEI